MWTHWNVHVRASPDGWLKDFEDTSGYYLVTAALNALVCMTGNQFLSTDSRLLTESPERLFMPMSAQCWVAVLTHSVQPHWFKKLPLPPLCKYESHTMKAKPTRTGRRLKLCHWVLWSSWCDQIHFKHSHLSCCLWSRAVHTVFTSLHKPLAMNSSSFF